MKKITYALITSVLLTPAAFANDTMSTNPSTCANFSGVTAGALLGYGSGNAHTTLYPTVNGVTQGTTRADVSLNGINGGVIVGWGKTVSRSKVYVGLEGSYIFDGSKGKLVSPVTSPAVPPPVASGANVLIKSKDSVDINLSLGLVFANSLVRISGGWANRKITAANYNTRFIDKRCNGWNAGGGIDTKVTPHVLVGMRYTYTMIPKTGTGALTSIDGSTIVAAANNTTARSSFSDNKVQVKIAYLFN